MSHAAFILMERWT